MSNQYTSDEIDQIEDEYLNINLENEEVEIFRSSTHVSIMENESDLNHDPKNLEIFKKPTSIKFLKDENSI